MNQVLAFLLGVVVGVALSLFVLREKAKKIALQKYSLYTDYLVGARKAKAVKRKERKERVVTCIVNKGEVGIDGICVETNIRRGEVEKHLKELESEGRVVKEGEFGKGIYYIKN
tara:strand:+ start:72 stop:413 length:342 start_codon:yes stop_codon:yes gene_type:complete